MVKPCRSSVRRVMESSAAKGTPPVMVRIIVPSTQCGFIIGKGGSKMKEIMKSSGAHVQLDIDMLPNSTERAVNIAVTPDVCPTDLCGHAWSSTDYHIKPDVDATASSHQPNDLIGCIIGRRGAKIKEIRQVSGAEIKIAEQVEGSEARQVTITGLPASISAAQYLINTEMKLRGSK